MSRCHGNGLGGAGDEGGGGGGAGDGKYEVGGFGLALRTVQKRQGWGLGGAVLGTVGRVEAQLQ